MRLKGLLVLPAALGCLLAVNAPAASAADCAGADLLASEQSPAQIESSVLCLINDRRATAGLGQVTTSNQLRIAASRHSGDMVNQGFFAHTSPAGDTFIDRIRATGYMRGASSWLVGENLVWGSAAYGTPAGMVHAWMDSAPHRENLLRSRFREIGISAVRGTPYESGDVQGVTVSSEYGYRGTPKDVAKKKKSRKARRTRKRAHARHR